MDNGAIVIQFGLKTQRPSWEKYVARVDLEEIKLLLRKNEPFRDKLMMVVYFSEVLQTAKGLGEMKKEEERITKSGYENNDCV